MGESYTDSAKGKGQEKRGGKQYTYDIYRNKAAYGFKF